MVASINQTSSGSAAGSSKVLLVDPRLLFDPLAYHDANDTSASSTHKTDAPRTAMTKPDEQGYSELPEVTPLERLAIFELSGTNRRRIGVVSALQSNDARWSLQMSGDASSMDKLRNVLEPYAASLRNSHAADEPPVRPDLRVVSAELVQQGYIVEVIPANDHQINFQFDRESGAIVGAASHLHEMAAANSASVHKVFSAISRSLSNKGNELAEELNTLLDKNDLATAVDKLKTAYDNGILSLPPSDQLLNTLIRIDVPCISPKRRRLVREIRIALADRLKRYGVAGVDAEALLHDEADSIDADRKAALETTVALAAIQRGRHETGLSILYGLVETPSQHPAETRAWTWRNISHTLAKLNRKDPKAVKAAQMSADAFLEAGIKIEAGKSLGFLADLLIEVDPSEAVRRLTEMITLLDAEGLLDRRIRAAALHSRANRLSRLNRHADAFRDAKEAVELSRGLLGAENALVSSLHLASMEACAIGAEAEAASFDAEAERVADEMRLPHSLLIRRIAHLAESFDPLEDVFILV